VKEEVGRGKEVESVPPRGFVFLIGKPLSGVVAKEVEVGSCSDLSGLNHGNPQGGREGGVRVDL
jgi:hypothetical protein